MVLEELRNNVDRKQPRISIVTTIYNRADKIERNFKSVASQTYGDFEHILIDDGSTDQIKPLVEKYMESAPYPVVYVQKENGGKHTATNLAWKKYAQGEFVVNLDSDDALEPFALEWLIGSWDQIPDKSRYWSVTARCKTQNSDTMCGKPYPSDINSMPEEKAKKIASSVGGDKIAMQRLDVVRQFYFPEYEGVTFVKESTVWNQIGWRYKSWYTNKIVRTYYVNEGGVALSRPSKTKKHIYNTLFSSGYVLKNINEYRLSGKQKIEMLLRYSVCKNVYGFDPFGYWKELKMAFKIVIQCLMPATMLMAYFYKKKMKKDEYPKR